MREDRERDTLCIYHQTEHLSQLEIITIIIIYFITGDWLLVQPASELLPLMSRSIFTVSVP